MQMRLANSIPTVWMGLGMFDSHFFTGGGAVFTGSALCALAPSAHRSGALGSLAAQRDTAGRERTCV